MTIIIISEVVRSVMEASRLNMRIFYDHFNSIQLLSNHNIVITINIFTGVSCFLLCAP